MRHLSSQDWHSDGGTVRDDNKRVIAVCSDQHLNARDRSSPPIAPADRERNTYAVAQLPSIFRLLDDVDTALATLKVGRDCKGGITPQAAGALADVWWRINELFGQIEDRAGPRDRARIIKEKGKAIFDGGTS